jgi:DNA-binding LacI/PurR family transcriptional regulator
MLQADANTFDRSAGARSMRRLLDLEHQPDAVFCVSDLLAVGAIHMIHEAGLRVPQDIAVAGFDNIKEGSSRTH